VQWSGVEWSAIGKGRERERALERLGYCTVELATL
jgi:hypothetical protein